MIELQNICFSVVTTDGKKCILDHVNLALPDNQLIVVTGPNGSGKSTLAKILMGIEKPTSGQILWDGKDITNVTVTERAKMGMSYAFQQPIRFKGITVLSLLCMASGKNLSVNEACKILSKVGLCAKDYIHREVNSSLSGGELKRIEIATSLGRSAKISLFDEPEAGIDIWSFKNLVHVFKEIREKSHGSILIISHQERILAIADKVIILQNGKIAECGVADLVFPALARHEDVCGCQYKR